MFPIDEVVKCCQPSEVVITMSVPDTDVGVNVAVFPFTVQVPVVFSCDPARSKELIQAAVECIQDLQANLVDDSYIKTLRETYRRNKETNLRSNEWWADRILYGAYLQDEPLSVADDTTSVPSWITSEAIRDAACKYLKTDNYVSATLRPEK